VARAVGAVVCRGMGTSGPQIGYAGSVGSGRNCHVGNMGGSLSLSGQLACDRRAQCRFLRRSASLHSASFQPFGDNYPMDGALSSKCLLDM
jgi:hypothetical protein